MLLAMVVLTTGYALAQEMPKPGKEHEFLKKAEGTWEVITKMSGTESKGTATYKMDLGGFWLQSTFEGEMFGAKFTGKSVEGFCPIKKKYTSTWTDSMSPSLIVMEGTYDEKTKTMTQTGEGPGMDGKLTKLKSITEYTDANTMKFSMYMGDEKEPAFVMAYTRKK
jgi:hypothetical protein